MKTFALTILFVLILSANEARSNDPTQSLVRVHVTTQTWDFWRPWEKSTPKNSSAVAPVLEGNKVLVSAELVANAVRLSFEHPGTRKKIPAKVEAVDYEANNALLASPEPFFSDTTPISLDTGTRIGDEVEVWQVESNGDPFSISAKMTRVRSSSYFLDEGYFLAYRITGPMQFRGGSNNAPVVRDGKLIGILVSYSSKNQESGVISAPIIEHFLTDLEDGNYEGFPSLGVGTSSTQDDQFRSYLGLKDEDGGLYVSRVLEDGSAADAGIKVGDVILKVSGKPIDSLGYYQDDDFGKTFFRRMLRGKPYVGDTVPITVWRDKQRIDLEATLKHQDNRNKLIDPYMFDRGPRYLVHGGLVFQELTENYLKTWGSSWSTKAPLKLVYANKYQDEFLTDNQKKLVILSRVLPNEITTGYDQISSNLVSAVNGQQIGSIQDLADAIEAPKNGIHSIEIDTNPKIIYLDAKKALKVNETIKDQYRIKDLSRLE